MLQLMPGPVVRNPCERFFESLPPQRGASALGTAQCIKVIEDIFRVL
jgi:hypothetical protein